MDGIVDTTNKPSGRVTTLAEYFESNPEKLHILNGNPERKGAFINGIMVEVGSVNWKIVAHVPIYHDTLFGEIRFIN